MLVFARYLVDRLRLPRAQAMRVWDVRRRLAAQPGVADVSEQEVQIALDLRRMREARSAAFGALDACARCARPPSRDWPGGDCCKAPSERLFTDDELSVLKLSGTTPARFRPARDVRDGCPFCGRTGCTLDPADRPNTCVRYVCRQVDEELRRRGDRGRVVALQSAIRIALLGFVTLRAARAERGAADGTIG
jgi:hypothetical protein